MVKYWNGYFLFCLAISVCLPLNLDSIYIQPKQ